MFPGIISFTNSVPVLTKNTVASPVMHIRSFRPLLPSSNEAAKALVCPPYDVVSRSEACAILECNPSSFISVVRPDATLPVAAPSSDSYNASYNALEALRSSSRLVRAPLPRLYVYEQRLGDRSQRGLVSLASVADYDRDVIKRHERTRAEKEEDRTRLTDHLSANVGPVFLTYPDVSRIDEITNNAIEEEPMFDVTPGDDGVRHRVWGLSELDSEKIVGLFDTNVPVSYIADGHHRAASAAGVGRKRKGKLGESWTGDEDFNWFLCALFPASQLSIMAYNRLVRDLNGLSHSDFIRQLSKRGELTRMKEPPSAVPETSGTVYIFVNDDWYSYILPRPDGKSGVAESLDASLLQHNVLGPVLGIEDPRKSDRIEFVGGVRGVPYLAKRVRNGDAAVAFALHPVTVQQLMEVADQGEIMPPKSTWFEPKLRSGFFVHTF